MRWSDIPRNPSERTLRQFGFLWLIFFGALSIWQGVWLEHPTAGWTLGAIAALGGAVGLLAPRWLRPIYVIWMVLAFPIGWLISHLILGLAFYGVFTPLALLFRLFGRDALLLRKPAVATYWQKKQTVTDPRRYFKQF